jgi:hypothetical protein
MYGRLQLKQLFQAFRPNISKVPGHILKISCLFILQDIKFPGKLLQPPGETFRQKRLVHLSPPNLSHSPVTHFLVSYRIWLQPFCSSNQSSSALPSFPPTYVHQSFHFPVPHLLSCFFVHCNFFQTEPIASLSLDSCAPPSFFLTLFSCQRHLCLQHQLLLHL